MADEFGDIIWNKGIELFGPKFWGTQFTEKHVEKIYKSLGYKYHPPKKAGGGKIKKYAKGGGVRKARYK